MHQVSNDTRDLQNEDSLIEMRLTHALETGPAVQITEDFAARVMQQLPTARPAALTQTYYGRKAMVVCMVLLGLALLLSYALHSISGSAAIQATEWLLYIQFVGLILWFSTRGRTQKIN